MPPQGICPVCQRTLTIKHDGTMRVHGREKDTGQRFTICAGSGKSPVAASS